MIQPSQQDRELVGKTAQQVISEAGEKRGVLIPILQKVQDKLGYLPEEAIVQISSQLCLSRSEVYGVATFYNFFRLKPAGANQISVCRGTACHVRGSLRVLEAVRQALGLQVGETTSDLKYSLDTVACIGACALAPNIVINGQPYGKMTAKKATDSLSNLPSETGLPPGIAGPGRAC